MFAVSGMMKKRIAPTRKLKPPNRKSALCPIAEKRNGLIMLHKKDPSPKPTTPNALPLARDCATAISFGYAKGGPTVRL